MLRSITYSSNLRSQRSEKDKWLKLSANRENSDYYVHESAKNNVLYTMMPVLVGALLNFYDCTSYS